MLTMVELMNLSEGDLIQRTIDGNGDSCSKLGIVVSVVKKEISEIEISWSDGGPPTKYRCGGGQGFRRLSDLIPWSTLRVKAKVAA